ncbi:1876_t:CDS:2 [Ambispora gerdemannii]|uniref:1876_t:CDS:1 n=1 Tax=Ambispora gerdemannii TaxID=144530 RepID=A0A9N8VS26_9GLOM|nr:1876_t:CDS:2 [Ambispora gerdemannii]
MHIKDPENASLKIFDIPGLPQIDDNAIQNALDAFDKFSFNNTGDEATDGLVKNFLNERKVLRELFEKSVTISILSANLANKIALYIEAFSAAGLENKMCDALIKSADRIADHTRDLAKEYDNFLQKLNGIMEESTIRNLDNEYQKATLETENQRLSNSAKHWRNASIALGVAAIVAAPLTAGVSLIVAEVVAVEAIVATTATTVTATAAALAAKKGVEKKADYKGQEIVKVDAKIDVLKSMIDKIVISLYNTKQFENMWQYFIAIWALAVATSVIG